jgi:S-adenosylmethionine decarboxylase proenzyme
MRGILLESHRRLKNKPAPVRLPARTQGFGSTDEFIGPNPQEVAWITYYLKERHVIGQFHQFSPQGVSGVVVIAESHICIHTWPEYGYAAADIFTCGDSVQPEKVAEIILGKLGGSSHSITKMPIGVLDA